jgi:hypothetical protein
VCPGSSAQLGLAEEIVGTINELNAQGRNLLPCLPLPVVQPASFVEALELGNPNGTA